MLCLSTHRDLFIQSHHSNLSTLQVEPPLTLYLLISAAEMELEYVRDPEGREKIPAVNLIEHLLSACAVQVPKRTLRNLETLKSDSLPFMDLKSFNEGQRAKGVNTKSIMFYNMPGQNVK